jgi:hypothetical protein
VSLLHIFTLYSKFYVLFIVAELGTSKQLLHFSAENNAMFVEYRTVFWVTAFTVMKPYRFVDNYERFGGTNILRPSAGQS